METMLQLTYLSFTAPRMDMDAFENALQSPLLKEGDVNNAKRVLFNIYLSSKGDNPVSMAESAYINTFMERFGNDVDVIWGYTIDDTLGEKVKVTLLATGFNVDSAIPAATTTQVSQPTVVVRPESDIISEVYGTSAEDRIFMENVRGSYVQFSLEEMDDDAFIEKVVNTPAYSRPTNFRQQIRGHEPMVSETESAQQNKTTNPIIF